MPVNTLLRTAGVFGAAVLVLSACGPQEDDPAPEETNGTGTEQEEQPPDGGGEDGSTDDGASADGIPELTEIEEQLWANSADQDSVLIQADTPSRMIGIDEPDEQELPGELEDEGEAEAESDEGGPDEVTEDEAENIEVIIAGDMSGDGSVWQVEGHLDYLLYDSGEMIYQTVESFVEEYRQLQPDEAAGPSADELGAALEAAGSWVDVSSTMVDQIESPAQFLEHIDDELLAEAGLDSLSDVEFAASEEERDGQEMWVYLYDEEDYYIELVVFADREEPLISELSLHAEDEQLSITFTEWNESEGLAEDEPDEEDVVSDDELDAIGQSLM